MAMERVMRRTDTSTLAAIFSNFRQLVPLHGDHDSLSLGMG